MTKDKWLSELQELKAVAGVEKQDFIAHLIRVMEVFFETLGCQSIAVLEPLPPAGEPKDALGLPADKRRIVDILPMAKGKWKVDVRGTLKATKRFADKADALAYAKKIAKRAALGQVMVRGSDGRIQLEYTYGKDPRVSKG